MFHAVIVDDEQHSIDRLTFLLHENCSRSVRVAGSSRTVEDGLLTISRVKPDLVFLDMQIGAETGFELLEKLPEIAFEVIFITAHEKYAVQAFRFSALDYLLKPVNRSELLEAIDKLKEKFSQRQQTEKLGILFHNLRNLNGASRKISLPAASGLIFPEISDIIRCEAAVNYTHIYLKGKQKITVARTLREFEELLADCNFYRVHNSHLINLAFIKSYQKGKGGSVSLSDGSRVEVSVRRKDGFLKKLAEI